MQAKKPNGGDAARFVTLAMKTTPGVDGAPGGVARPAGDQDQPFRIGRELQTSERPLNSERLAPDHCHLPARSSRQSRLSSVLVC
jgi:hypothetical protein